MGEGPSVELVEDLACLRPVPDSCTLGMDSRTPAFGDSTIVIALTEFFVHCFLLFKWNIPSCYRCRGGHPRVFPLASSRRTPRTIDAKVRPSPPPFGVLQIDDLPYLEKAPGKLLPSAW